MDNKVYVLTSGEYSDYGIDGIFFDKKLAEDIRDKQGYGDVNEYDVLEAEGKLRQGFRRFQVKMTKGGKGSIEDYFGSPYDMYDRNSYFFVYDGSAMYHDCVARDAKHAIKLTNELRVRLKADGLWDANKNNYFYNENKTLD